VENEKKPTGWLRLSRFSEKELHLVIYSEGDQQTSYVNFRVPIGILKRLLSEEVKACPVFDEVGPRP
jgi:hypothetical protein